MLYACVSRCGYSVDTTALLRSRSSVSTLLCNSPSDHSGVMAVYCIVIIGGCLEMKLTDIEKQMLLLLLNQSNLITGQFTHTG